MVVVVVLQGPLCAAIGHVPFIATFGSLPPCARATPPFPALRTLTMSCAFMHTLPDGVETMRGGGGIGWVSV